MTLAIVLLAAGHGTRMNSKKQKILHTVGGKAMFLHVFEEAEEAADLRPVLVVAPGETGIHSLVRERAQYAEQPERLGTGHATMMAMYLLQGQSDQVLVTYGDMPLLRAETMAKLARTQADTGAALSMFTIDGPPQSTFGRVMRDDAGNVREIVEVAQARRMPDGDKIINVPELNVGVYCFEASFLWQNLPHLPLRQARSGQEYYLTDMVEIAVKQGRAVVAIKGQDPDEGLGAGTRAEMVQVERAFQRRTNNYWLENGVTLVDPDSTYIDDTVQIGQDTVIWPNSYLHGDTIIGQDCEIGPSVVLRDVTVSDGARVNPFTHQEGGIF